MRSFLALGFVSLVAGAGMFACGDDSSDDPTPTLGGSGGTGGGGAGGTPSGGSAGTPSGGSAGTPSGGTGGTGGVAPNVTPQATCTGCVELITPVTGPNDNGGTTNVADQAIFQFSTAAGTVLDFTDAVVTWRIAAVAPNANYFATIFAQNGMPQNFAGAYQFFALDPTAFPANSFRDVVIDVAAVAAVAGDAGVPDAAPPEEVVADAGDAGAAPALPTIVGAFDKSQITSYGITIGVGAAFTGSAVVRVAVDQVTVAGVPGQAPITFTAGV